MGRKRASRLSISLPKNLYYDSRNGRYRYKHPLTGKFHGMGSNKSEAIEAANILNHELMGSDNLVSKVKGLNKKTMGMACDSYKEEKIIKKKLAQSTKKGYLIAVKQIHKEFKDCPIGTLTTEKIATFLNENFNEELGNASSYVITRSMFIWVFDYSIRLGWVESNPARITEAKPKPRSRVRWTKETYAATYEAASPELKRAMDLCLYTAFGISELITLKFSDIDTDGKAIEKMRQKTGANQRIFMNKQLSGVIKRCRNTGIPSPFVLHRRPKRIPSKKHQSVDREHWTQWTDNTLQQELQRTRESTGLFEGIPAKNCPGFHCIRALGAWLLHKQGVPIESISALLAHRDTKTTEIYLAGHEPEWIESYAALDI